MYTEENVSILMQYPAVSVEELSLLLGRSERSIIGKLSRLGIYQRKTYASKSGEPVISKLEIVAELEMMLNMSLSGLEKAPKEVLLRVRSELKSRGYPNC